jgi:hypothetical protein
LGERLKLEGIHRNVFIPDAKIPPYPNPLPKGRGEVENPANGRGY